MLSNIIFYSFITDGNSGFHISLLRLLLQRKCETFPTFPQRSLWRNAATSPTHLRAAVGAPSAHLVAKLGSFYCRAAGNRPGNRNNQCLEQKQEWFFIASLCMKRFTPQQCYALGRSSPHYSGQSLSSWYDRIAKWYSTWWLHINGAIHLWLRKNYPLPKRKMGDNIILLQWKIPFHKITKLCSCFTLNVSKPLPWCSHVGNLK